MLKMYKAFFLAATFCFFSFTSLFAETAQSESIPTAHKAKSASVSSNKPLVILDAGHGGSDEGAKVKSFKEKKITLATVLYTKKYLEQMGYRVILTRGKDMSISLPRRVAIANKTRPSLFVSIHFNASRNSSAQGIEIFYCDTKDSERARASRRLANCVLHYVIDQTSAISRGVKAGNFHVIRETHMPAVLLEGGFVTNYEECAHLKNRAYLESIAKGVAQGIDKFLKS